QYKHEKMADISELKHMVMSFRVSELQVLLGFAGRNKTGKKQELLQRALQLVQKGCSTPVQIKIRELYRRFPSKTSTAHTSPVKAPHNRQPNTLQDALGSPLDYSKGAVAPSSQVPVHPDVNFRPLAFYDKLGELLKPSSLVPRGNSRFQETFFVFHLTPQQAQDIALSRDIRPDMRAEYTVQVQLRFCLLETSCEQNDNFPPSICVRVNGKMCPLPNPIPTNKPNVEPRRPPRPVNITPLCRISPTSPNHINISWSNSDFGRSFCVAVFLVRKLNSDILLHRLKQSGIRHPDHTRAQVKEKLAQDMDSEIATTSLRVSLNCPLGKMRMSTPGRCSSCTHLQCFDVPMYLQMNEKKPTWICPVCDKPAHYENLFLDGYFAEIIRDAQGETEIQFHADGTWSRQEIKKEVDLISTTPVVKAPAAQVAVKEEEKKPTVVTVDLTLSSDSEDDEPKKAPSISQSLFPAGDTTSQMSSGIPPVPPLIPLLQNELASAIGSISVTQPTTTLASTMTSAGARGDPHNIQSNNMELMNLLHGKEGMSSVDSELDNLLSSMPTRPSTGNTTVTLDDSTQGSPPDIISID
ncbi:unnamed protein product, partial [Owenia fusiformis]